MAAGSLLAANGAGGRWRKLVEVLSMKLNVPTGLSRGHAPNDTQFVNGVATLVEAKISFVEPAMLVKPS